MTPAPDVSRELIHGKRKRQQARLDNHRSMEQSRQKTENDAFLLQVFK